MNVTVPDSLDGERVDRVVALLTGLARADAAALVDAGRVAIGGQAVKARSRRVRPGESLDVDVPATAVPELAADPAVSLDVLFADEEIIVIDKPAGLVVHPGSGTPGGTLVNGLLARFPDLAAHAWPDPARPGIVHRLDKGTSGVLVVARTPAALASLAGQLRGRTMQREYLALVWGSVEGSKGVIDAPLARSIRDPQRMAVRAGGRRAVTRYEVEARASEPADVTLLRCRLETGRTHQIRVHLKAIGHPVVGDDRYGRRGPIRLARPFLHAVTLAFDHPSSGERMRFSSPLPADLAAVRATLR